MKDQTTALASGETNPPAASEAQRLAQAISRRFELADLHLPEEYSYASLPLCVVDAVFSIGVTYTSTQNTVQRFCDATGWPRLRDGGGEHTISDLLAILEASTPEAAASDLFGNRQRTSATSGIVKAEAVERFALALQAHGVERFSDLAQAEESLLRAAILLIPGQGSGISLDYFMMLAGSDDEVKADRMVCRFASEVLDRTVTPREAGTLVKDAVAALKGVWPSITPRLMDYAIWSHQRVVAA